MDLSGKCARPTLFGPLSLNPARFTEESDQQRALIEMHGLYCLSRPSTFRVHVSAQILLMFSLSSLPSEDLARHCKAQGSTGGRPCLPCPESICKPGPPNDALVAPDPRPDDGPKYFWSARLVVDPNLCIEQLASYCLRIYIFRSVAEL